MPRYEIKEGERRKVEATRPAERAAARNADGRRINAPWQCPPSPKGSGATSQPAPDETPAGQLPAARRKEK